MSKVTIAVSTELSEGEFNDVSQHARDAKMTVPDWVRSRLLLPTIPVFPALPEKALPESHEVVGPVPGIKMRGFQQIMDIADKIAAARRQIQKEIGGGLTGRKYKVAIAEQYSKMGLVDFNRSTRNSLAEIAKSADLIRTWHRGLLGKDKLEFDQLSPSGIVYRWKQFKNDKSRLREKPETAAAVPLLRKSTPTTPVDITTAPVYRNGKLTRASTDDVLNQAASGPVVMTESVSETRYETFADVSLDHLDAQDSRILRRFTHRLSMIRPIDNKTSSSDIATVIRKIRDQNEHGDTPPTALALIRLGVLRGSSGDYTLRPEFVAHASLIVKWAESAPTTTSAA